MRSCSMRRGSAGWRSARARRSQSTGNASCSAASASGGRARRRGRGERCHGQGGRSRRGIVYGVAYEGNVKYPPPHGATRAGSSSSSPTFRAATPGCFRRATTRTSASAAGRAKAEAARAPAAGLRGPRGRPEELEELRGHRLRCGARDADRGRARAPRGDAAGLIDPVSGDGMYECFVSGRRPRRDQWICSRAGPPRSRLRARGDSELAPLHRPRGSSRRRSTAGRARRGRSRARSSLGVRSAGCSTAICPIRAAARPCPCTAPRPRDSRARRLRAAVSSSGRPTSRSRARAGRRVADDDRDELECQPRGGRGDRERPIVVDVVDIGLDDVGAPSAPVRSAPGSRRRGTLCSGRRRRRLSAERLAGRGGMLASACDRYVRVRARGRDQGAVDADSGEGDRAVDLHLALGQADRGSPLSGAMERERARREDRISAMIASDRITIATTPRSS